MQPSKKIFFYFFVYLLFTNIIHSQYSDTLCSIKTPRGSDVPDTYINQELKNDDRANFDLWYLQHYPDATQIKLPGEQYSSSRRFNCHGYGWHYITIGELVWIGASQPGSEEIYWNDGSYDQLSESQATKVSYTKDHSAITSNTPDYYYSKWGPFPLMFHHKDYTPGYGTANQFFRRSVDVPQDQLSISSALNSAVSGQTVVVSSGNLTINSTTTIKSGVTLQINSGTIISFAPGTYLIVNGTFDVVGTSTSKITFDRIGTSGQWSGIQFNAGSYGNIQYANISNASPGIAVYSSNNIKIENSTFTDCFNSVFALSGTAYIYKNTITGSYYSGIRAQTSSNITLAKQTLGQGSNQIKDGRTGSYAGPALYAGGNTYILAGDEVFGDGGYNSITNYPSFVTSDNAWVDACYNWWGSYPPSSSGFITGNGGTINYLPALSSAPSLSKLSAQTESSMNEKLSKALVMKSKGDFNNAQQLLEQLLEENSNNNLTEFIIVHLGDCINKLKGDFSSYSKNKKINSKYQQLINELTADKKANNGEVETAIKMYEEIINTKPEAEREKSSLFKAAVLYESFKSDKQTAEKYYDELIKKYPEDELSKFIYLKRGQLYDAKNNYVMNNESKAEESFSLYQNSPNPFNPTTKITFTLPSKDVVKIKVYDILGREVAVLANGIFEVGNHEIEFNASRQPSGVYFYNLTTSSNSITKKMLLLK